MAGVRVIVKATDRIEKFRDAKNMVCASCEAARQASKSQASRHLECSRARAAGSCLCARFSDPRGMDPRIFLLWRKRIRLRFFALFGR